MNSLDPFLRSWARQLCMVAALVCCVEVTKRKLLTKVGKRTLCQSKGILLHLASKTTSFSGTAAEQKHVTEWLFWETNRVGFSVPNLRHAIRWGKHPSDVLRYLRNRAVVDLETLNVALRTAAYLLPSGPTIADLSCAAYLFWLDQAEISVTEYPNIEGWLSRLSGLPGWQHPDIALQPARE
jgi:glutathione S-transferase